MEYVKLAAGHGQLSNFHLHFLIFLHNFPFACLSWLYSIVFLAFAIMAGEN